MDLALLEKTLAARDEPRFRARQVWAWTARAARGYEEMTDLPAGLRDALERELPFSSLTLHEEARASDGTVKALFATADGRALEAVLMRYRDGRRSICLSSQSGCPLTCTFCATGQMKFARNLTASEIVDQALHFHRMQRGTERLTNCVFMGMGEPLLNLDNVLAACERLPDLGIGHRHTAISTVGWIPGIEALAEQDMPLRLALSLHAADEALRSELMPVNDRYPLSDVVEACRDFYARKRRRVFVEYVMLKGLNDRYEQALALARLLTGTDRTATRAAGATRDSSGGSIFKVNLIPYNPTGSPYEGSTRASIAAFRDALLANGVPATIRLTRGQDIDAACGQLAARTPQDFGDRGGTSFEKGSSKLPNDCADCKHP
jgi:23S rRNA (adenine2503-C2)-methyltransferase